MCKTTNEVQGYYNPSGKTPPRLVNSANPTQGLSKTYVKASDWFICSFTRQKTLAGVSEFFDFENKRYYIFGVNGPLNTTTSNSQELNLKKIEFVNFDFIDEPSQHNGGFRSSKTYNFAAYSDSLVDTAKTLSDCGKSQGCFAHPSGCTGADCQFIYKWQDRFSSVLFTLAGKYKMANSYLAIGFSDDQKMV
jgi:hypothetical protein